MDAANRKSTLNVFWTKTEKEMHVSRKAKSPVFRPVKSEDKLVGGGFQAPVITTIEFPTTENDLAMQTESKVSIKDLCSEDKARIANLVKELAKKEEEKDDIKKCLESERQLYESKLKEMLEQQDRLLKEKEMLLLNFAQKQEKLEKLSRKKDKKSRKQDDIEVDDKKNSHVNALFVPEKASTPNNCSLRSISPILMNEKIKNQRNKTEGIFTKEIDNEIVKIKGKPLLNSTIINEHNNNQLPAKRPTPDVEDKKQQLMQQRVDLVNEQRMLKELIDQQERLLREKNDQIMLQQKLHRERLEQLIVKKSECVNTIPSQQHPASSINHMAKQLSGLNLNQPRSMVSQNTSVCSNSSSKLKQENSFDIFDLIGDQRLPQRHSELHYADPNDRHCHREETRQQLQYHQANSLATTIDEDENKLFEEIFFVN